MCLTLDISLRFFRLYLSSTMMRVTCMKDLFQFENFEFHAFKHYLYALKFSNFKDLSPELRLLYVISHLTSLADMSKTELLYFLQSLFHLHSLCISAGGASILLASQFKSLGVILDSSVLYPVSSLLANSVGSAFRISLFTICITSIII